MIKYQTSLFLLLIILTALLTACDEFDDISYAPDTFGESNHCYYVYDPDEAVALQRKGLCPHAWTPMIMPLLWHETYYSYYDSPAYYDHYIPVQRRTYYRTTVIRQFETVHKVEITKYSLKGKWKGSDGKRYDGKTVTTRVRSKTTTTKTQGKSVRTKTTTSKSKTTTTRSRTTVRTSRSR